MKLCQCIALVDGKKSRTQQAITAVHHKLQKGDLSNGLTRTYRPKDDEGEKLPSESKLVQVKVNEELNLVADVMVNLWDMVATQDTANCIAKANVVVDGNVVLNGVPVTTLLFLAKQLTDVHTLIEKLPTLDPTEVWNFNEASALYASNPSETTRTKKVPKSFVAYEATDKHPAQVQVYNEDILVGYWTQIKFSGSIPETRRQELLNRVRKLQDAVKAAREEANTIEAVDVTVGKSVFDYLLK